MNTYKFRIYPNDTQVERLNLMFDCSMFVWNYFLDLNNKIYLEAKEKDLTQKRLSYYDCTSMLTKLKKEKEWLTSANSQSLQQTLKDLDTAYNRFFHKQNSFPKFKGKNNKQSFRIPQFFVVKENKIYFPKFKDGIKVNVHREVFGNIKYATILKTKTGKYFVSINTDFEDKKDRISSNQIGIDLGIKDFVVVSNGERYKAPKESDCKIKFLQRRLSKKKKGSKNRDKIRTRIAKEYEKIENRKQDFQHKLSNKLCKENILIATENLDIRGMVKNHSVAKSISRQGWHSFITKLEYKSKKYSGRIERVGRFYPSSKTCNNCGYINQTITLKNREWECPVCKNKIDRDINASKNILSQAQRELNISGCRSDNPKPVELLSIDKAMKQEASSIKDWQLTEDFNRYYEYFDMLVQFCDSMYKKMYKQSRIEDAKDIVQDCYLKAFLNFVDGDFLQYMKVLIKNQFINEQKKMKFIGIEDI